MKKIVWIILLGTAMSVGWLPPGSASDNTSEIILMAHDSFSVSKAVVAEFETRHRVRLRFLKAGDTGAMLNQAILSKNNPMADVLFGVDNKFLSHTPQEASGYLRHHHRSLRLQLVLHLFVCY